MKRDVLRFGIVLLVLVGMSGCIFQESSEETADQETTIARGQETSPPQTSPPQTSPPTDINTWLQQNVIPFKTAEPGTTYEDLMPLKDVIGDARIVALGEATHGTSEFFKMKHRILRFLVEEMGFNLFAIEASWPESNLVNDYVHTGEGNPRKLLAGLRYWTWNTDEVLDMIVWMKKHNKNPGTAPQVSFYGVDMVYPIMAMDNVVNYLQKVDPDAVEYVDSLYEPFRLIAEDDLDLLDYSNASDSIQNQHRKNMQEVYDFLESHQAVYEAASSPEEFAFALQSARICVQSEDAYSKRESYNARDKYMAENVSWILNQAGPNAKIVLWAHNGHVGKGPPGSSMGTYLEEKYGDQMVVFGFTFYSGSFNARTGEGLHNVGVVIKHWVEPPPKDSFEYCFHEVGVPLFFLDLQAIPPGPATHWLLEPHYIRTIGALYDDSRPLHFFQKAILPSAFDVIIYFENTTASHLLSPPSGIGFFQVSIM